MARDQVRTLSGILPEVLVEQLSLVVSELVTNALRHATVADPAPTLRVTVEADRVLVEVIDHGSAFDVLTGRRPGPDGGFGLPLVDSIADRWWVDQQPTTRVVCEFSR